MDSDETPTAHHRRTWLGLTILCTALTIGTAQAGTNDLGTLDLGRLSARDAEIRIEAAHHAPAPGIHIRCGPGRRVGVWLQSHEPISLQDLIIDGCQVGLLHADVLDAETGEPLASGVHTITGLSASTCTVGIWLAGSSGTVTSNSVSTCQYGILVSGHSYVIDLNQVFNNLKAGMIVVGDKNTLRQNTVTNNGAYGLRVVHSVPRIAANVYLNSYLDRAVSNMIKENTMTGHSVYDLSQWPVSCPWTKNTYQNNTADTRSIYCLY